MNLAAAMVERVERVLTSDVWMIGSGAAEANKWQGGDESEWSFDLNPTDP